MPLEPTDPLSRFIPSSPPRARSSAPAKLPRAHALPSTPHAPLTLPTSALPSPTFHLTSLIAIASLSLALTLVFTLTLITPAPTHAASRAPAQATHGMVVTGTPQPAAIGLAMLERGGNAVDAAIATAFAISVTQPFSSGLGGGAFILIRTAKGEVVAIDARETAPAAATRDMYVKPGVPERASMFGPLAVGTPGLVAGLALAQERWGTLPLAEVIAPSIALAREGFAVGPYHVAKIEFMRKYLTPERTPETVRIQFPPAGAPAEVGWRLVQEDLAKTLERIAEHGPAGFYEGPVAEAIVGRVQELGGILTLADLAGYKPKLRPVVEGSYRGIEVFSFPPPSSGGAVLLEILNILEGVDLASKGAGSSASVHVIGEAMKLAFADRAALMGDPDFVDVPVAQLVSKAYGERQRARINPPCGGAGGAKLSVSVDGMVSLDSQPDSNDAPCYRGESVIEVKGPGLELDDAGTAHLSVVDRAGNAVAITKTINTSYGSGITAPGTGVILNNEMDDFAIAPDTPNAYGLVDTRGSNAIAPGKRPLSSMTPTILVKDGKPFMVTGSPGGPRIITTTLLTILNVVDYGMNAQEAVAAPRFHHQWVPNRLALEPEFSADVVEALRARGHEVQRSSRHWSLAQTIVIDPETGEMTGGSDPRGDGEAVGY